MGEKKRGSLQDCGANPPEYCGGPWDGNGVQPVASDPYWQFEEHWLKAPGGRYRPAANQRDFDWVPDDKARS